MLHERDITMLRKRMNINCNNITLWRAVLVGNDSVTANPDGSTRINRTTKVTGKGQQYFINKFLGQAG